MRSHRQHWTHVLILALLVGGDGSILAAQATATSTTKTTPTTAPAATAPPASELFSKDQLEQLVAPIALYPDALLAQIFMAATYPLEVVEAERFMTANASLKGTALDEKLKEYDWQAEIKALCLMPEVLKKMSENLDWTQDLGDAFLGQKAQLMDTVQVMRNKAYDAGNLKSNEKQTIKVENTVNVQTTGGAAPAPAPAPSGSDGDQIIIIESSSPEVIYVPQYAPTAVYPGWSYPSYYYPPMYPYYPPGAGLITFGVGMAVGAAIWGDCNWGGGWGHGDVDIDINRNNNFNRNTSINGGNRATTTGTRGGKQSFQHNAAGRKGVSYGNSQVAGQYGAKSGSSRVSKGQGTASAQARGRSGEAAGSRQARTPSASTQGAQGKAGGGQGAAARDRQGSGAQGGGDRAAAAKGSGDRAGSAKASGGGQRASGSKASSYGASGSGRSAYGGSSSPSASRASSSRGSMSRGTTSYGGGGSRGGGGARGGGGGRRR